MGVRQALLVHVVIRAIILLVTAAELPAHERQRAETVRDVVEGVRVRIAEALQHARIAEERLPAFGVVAFESCDRSCSTAISLTPKPGR